MDDRDKVIAHLRTLSSEALVVLLREARVCVGWEDYTVDEDEDEIDASQLHNLVNRAVAMCRKDARNRRLWHWSNPTPDGRPGPCGTAPDLASAQRAAEDAAIAAGYRVPWRQT